MLTEISAVIREYPILTFIAGISFTISWRYYDELVRNKRLSKETILVIRRLVFFLSVCVLIMGIVIGIMIVKEHGSG